MKFNTKLIHSGVLHDELGSAITPIYQTSTFRFTSPEQGAALFAGEEEGYIYTRIGNPTVRAFEKKLASLENGTDAIALSSGMAAATTVYQTLLSQGDHILCTDAVYGPSRSVLASHFSRFGIDSGFVDTSSIEDVKSSVKKNTKVIYLETPANPTIGISDIKEISEFAHKKNIKIVVDNTFCSPYLQNPLDLGADVVLHSLTKFINGHADIVGGAIIAKDQSLLSSLRKTMIVMGCNMDPHQAFLADRGVKTLSIRMDRAIQNAKSIAVFLEQHSKVEWVRYPGLLSHPQFDIARKQMRGPGAVMSFELKGGFSAGKELLRNVKLMVLAVSLGGVETLIQHPASMTHAGVSAEEKKKAGISDGLVRLSVGIEDIDDLIDDLKQALEKV